ncbi:hypothetical protein [Metabacillus sp. Hm71]|uniref:hypothetical protein n=1 Tax=Metabacillus sp. Hm71 TaxID=3450743 RepID=UPI003F42B98E
MIVKDLYLECIRLEESTLAHYIYHLLEEQKLSLDDSIFSIDLDQADHQKVAELIEKNVLSFHKVGIYSLKMNKNDFVFIFARSQQQAIQFYTETFYQAPLNCHEYLLDFELARGNEVISFRDLRKEFESFPAIAGYFNQTDIEVEAVQLNDPSA